MQDIKFVVTTQVMKSTKKPLFNPYDGLFARFARILTRMGGSFFGKAEK
jgi:hypothetical protein